MKLRPDKIQLIGVPLIRRRIGRKRFSISPNTCLTDTSLNRCQASLCQQAQWMLAVLQRQRDRAS